MLKYIGNDIRDKIKCQIPNNQVCNRVSMKVLSKSNVMIKLKMKRHLEFMIAEPIRIDTFNRVYSTW